MMRSKPASSLQKTYDECYLICSTAVYFEGQNNEEEALRSWRSALETIYYHNAYRLPSKYAPKTETEKALHESIRQLEIQCRERVDLLQALHESRKDAAKEGMAGDGNSPSADTAGSSSAGIPAAGGSGKRKPSGSGGPSPSTTTPHTPGYIGDGTIPAIDYMDLSKPPPLPGLPGGPPVVAAGTSKSSGESTPVTEETSTRWTKGSPSSRTKSHGSRSPERRKSGPMLTTLRSSDPKKQQDKKTSPGKLSPKRKEKEREVDLRPAASQAAGLAWESINRSPSAEMGGNYSGDEMRRVGRDDGNELIPDSRATTTRSPRTRPSPVGPRQQFEVRKPASPSQSQSQSPSKPTVMPKPAPLRAAHQVTQTTQSDPEPTSSSPRRNRPANSPSEPETKSASRTRVAPDGRAPYSIGSADERVDDSMNKMSVSETPPRRKQPKRSVTPASSDQESSGHKSTDEEDNNDDDFMKVMDKLPKGVDPSSAKQILNDIVVRGDEVHWNDIAGLERAKKALKEAVVYPFLRPDLFSGLREPARGMLLFGPPGTGKTMLARAVATESKSTFFSVSASTLTSKWHGESEKLVRALFGLAKSLAPSIIFVDEIDSLLSARSSGAEHEASRRSKTEFLIQWSDLQGAAAGREQSTKDKKEGDASRVLVLAATNMPWDIDEAARRRFVRRQYIPLPEHHVRTLQFVNLLSHQIHELSHDDIEVLVQLTEGFSGSDITALAKDAAMGPLRNLGEALLHTPMDQIRPIRFADFEASLYSIRPSVSKEGLREYEDWARKFGERGG